MIYIYIIYIYTYNIYIYIYVYISKNYFFQVIFKIPRAGHHSATFPSGHPWPWNIPALKHQTAGKIHPLISIKVLTGYLLRDDIS